MIADWQNNLTSGGQPVIVTFDAAAGILSVALQNGAPVLTMTLSAQQATNSTTTSVNDVQVTLVATQFLPLDHLDIATSPYFTSNTDAMTFTVPVMATDSDGDNLLSASTVAVTINDGALPVLGEGAGVTVNETQDANQTVSGTIGIDVGSDAIASLLFAANQPAVSATSDGNALSWVSAGDPASSELRLEDGAGNVVLTVSINASGQFDVVLLGTLDHTGTDPDSNSIPLPVNVVITDNDGDQAAGEITVTVTDGDDPAGGNTVAVALVEPDLVNEAGNSDYPATATQSDVLTAGSDRLLPESVQITPTEVAAILAELNAEIAAGGAALTFTYDPASGLLSGALANGTEVVSLTLTATQASNGQDVDLALTWVQRAPLDHNLNGNNTGFVSVNGEQIVLRLPVQAQDVDGDVLTTPVSVTATSVDGPIPQLLTDSGITANETADLNTTLNGQIDVNVGSDAVAAITFAAEQSAFDDLFSDGQPVQIEVVGGNTLNGFIEQNGTRVPVLTVVMTPTGNYTLTLTNNLDHLSDDTITLPLDVVVTDDDGDTNTGQITLTITDGDDPAFGDDSGVALNEGDDGNATGNGTIAVVGGSDDVVAVFFSPSQPSLNGLTSNGFATSVTVSSVGSGGQITVVRADQPDIVVLTITIGIDGSYTVTQSQPLDQPIDNLNTLALNVTVEDRDGDTAQGVVTVTITDGTDPAGGNTAAIAFTEGDLSPSPPTVGYPVSGSSQITIAAGVDRLNPTTITLDPVQIANLLNEFAAEVTAGGNAVVATWTAAPNANSGVGTLTLTTTGEGGGEVVLTAVLTATQNSDGQQVDITTVVTQFSPLDHNGTNDTGLVRQLNDTIVFDLPVQVQDTDGDSLTTPALITTTITDGVDPVINGIPPLLVKESDIDTGGNFHPGSNPSGTEQTASGQLSFNTGSDAIIAYQVDVAAFNAANAGTLTAGGTQVLLVFNSAASTASSQRYDGQVNGVPIFTLVLRADGSYTFTLLGALDHVQPQNDTQLTMDFAVQAQDQDGDLSAPVNLQITVDDDVPQTADAAFPAVEEGSTTPTLDVLTEREEGADDAAVTAVIINGERQTLTGTPNPQAFFRSM